MKGIILALLISYIFCINYLPKYGTIKVRENSGSFYLNTNEFDADSTIYIELTVSKGKIDSTLLYEFTNISPNSYYLIPSNKLTPKVTGSSGTKKKRSKSTLDHDYYYSLQNNNSYPYLIIYYKGLTGEYLEIESTRVNWGVTIMIIIFSVIGLAGLLILGIYIYKRCNATNVVENIDNMPTQPISPNPNTGEYTGEKPYYSNDPQYNSVNYNSNYPQQQQLQDINNGQSINS